MQTLFIFFFQKQREFHGYAMALILHDSSHMQKSTTSNLRHRDEHPPSAECWHRGLVGGGSGSDLWHLACGGSSSVETELTHGK